ncbi:MAG: 50S ribosomal protein L30 [Armatimonadota bacterium]|nr:50S ribosomal protein L30 [Armatimonadota bacterium]
MLKITLKKSAIGYNETQKATIRALGLGKMNSSSILPDNDQIRGMARKVSHLVDVEVVEGEVSGGKK